MHVLLLSKPNPLVSLKSNQADDASTDTRRHFDVTLKGEQARR